MLSFGSVSAADAEEHALNERDEDQEQFMQVDGAEEFAEEEAEFVAEEVEEDIDESESMEEDSGPVVEVLAASSTPVSP